MLPLSLHHNPHFTVSHSNNPPSPPHVTILSTFQSSSSAVLPFSCPPPSLSLHSLFYLFSRRPHLPSSSYTPLTSLSHLSPFSLPSPLPLLSPLSPPSLYFSPTLFYFPFPILFLSSSFNVPLLVYRLDPSPSFSRFPVPTASSSFSKHVFSSISLPGLCLPSSFYLCHLSYPFILATSLSPTFRLSPLHSPPSFLSQLHHNLAICDLIPSNNHLPSLRANLVILLSPFSPLSPLPLPISQFLQTLPAP